MNSKNYIIKKNKKNEEKEQEKEKEPIKKEEKEEEEKMHIEYDNKNKYLQNINLFPEKSIQEDENILYQLSTLIKSESRKYMIKIK